MTDDESMTGADDGTTATAARYDTIADGYERWWGPVIAPAALALLDDLAPLLPARTGLRLLDVGVGTGTLALAALARWPDSCVTGVDPSAAMLELARAKAAERLPAGGADAFETVTASADGLPFDDGTFDAAMTSFVIQLVPNRRRALVEIRRVLRPGAPVALVTWLRSSEPYRPDALLDEVLAEFGFDPREPEPRSGEYASVEAAAASLRRAGYRHVQAAGAVLEHRWDAAGYVAFIEHFDEASTFESLEPAERDDLRARLLERLASLTADELVLRLPTVTAVGLAGRAGRGLAGLAAPAGRRSA